MAQVENALFKVPRFQFERHSKIFATPFSLPQPAAGTDDKNPFKLCGIKKEDFQALLKVLYPMYATEHAYSPLVKLINIRHRTAIPQLPELKHEEWISVLHLASRWDFIEVRNLAIQKLELYAEMLGAAERILLARKYDVASWLRSGYTQLLRRKIPISSEEAGKIGWEVALQICQLREAAVAPDGFSNPYDKALLGFAFQAEFKRVEGAHRPLPSPTPFLATKNSPPTAGGATATAGAKVDPFKFFSTPPFPTATSGFTSTPSQLSSFPLPKPQATNPASSATPTKMPAPLKESPFDGPMSKPNTNILNNSTNTTPTPAPTSTAPPSGSSGTSGKLDAGAPVASTARTGNNSQSDPRPIETNFYNLKAKVEFPAPTSTDTGRGSAPAIATPSA